MRIFFAILILFGLAVPEVKSQETTGKPNIIWIVCEDISPDLPMYGDSTASTPNLDALASHSTIYSHAFTTAGVCAPSRSALITGVHQTAIGSMHMRTGKDVFAWGKREYADKEEFTDINGDTLRQYAVVTPPEIKCFPEYLRKAGYFCSNNAKTDYQFAAPLSSWDENGNKAHWRNRKEGQAFFSVFNIGLTHESRLWKHEDKVLTVDPNSVEVPPYLQDSELSRKMIARHYSNIELMDAELGKIIGQLKDDGLYENSYIFFYSDHGGPLPREKREMFDSGLHVPLVIKKPGQKEAKWDDQLISFLDLAPSMLSVAEVPIPGYLEGRAFLGKEESEEKRTYIFAAADRLDEKTDRVRAIRDHRFLYIRNYFSDRSHYEDLGYRKNIPSMMEMLKLKEEGKLNEEQMRWFENKPWEELYDSELDPHNIHNLANDPKYADILYKMRARYRERIQKYPDLGNIPEAQWIDMMWPGGEQPSTSNPEFRRNNGEIILSCKTPGASISYRYSDQEGEELNFDDHWQLYNRPIELRQDRFLYVLAERIGYRISEMLVIQAH